METASASAAKLAKPADRHRLGAVSFLNARPLIHGLDDSQDIELHLDVPSRLAAGLADARFDVALLPVIDYARLPGLRIIPVGGIGCDGPTLTVRIFSRQPVSQISTLACDTDSHASVALARIVLAERFGLYPRIVDLNRDAPDPGAAQLLIGDKVVCEEPSGFPHQIDLGEQWKELTGLPFVFAVWMARPGVELRDLPRRLAAARAAGLRSVPQIIEQFAVPRGWPAELARRYLTSHLHFEIGPGQLQAMRIFIDKATRHGIISSAEELRIESI